MITTKDPVLFAILALRDISNAAVRIAGTLRSTVCPLPVSSDAAIIFSAAFFAPCTKTVPCSGAPPRTR